MADLVHSGTYRAPERRASISLSLNATAWALVVTTLLVIVLGIFREWFVAQYGVETIFQDMRHIGLDREMCLGAWYSALLLVAAAGLLFVISRLAKELGHGDIIYWTVLAITFVGLSLDEETSVHELALEPIRNALHASGPFYFAWVIPALVMVPLFGLAYLGFLKRLPKPYGLWFFISGAIYVGGALGMEMVGGMAYLTYGGHSLAYVTSFIIEESMEMIGATSFVIALMSYLRHIYALNLSYHA